jgi:chaperone modulatory protein CbpM
VSEHELFTGVVLDDTLTLTLNEVCEICGLQESVVIEMVQEGVAEPIESSTDRWVFSGIAVTRLRTAYRLQRDLQINLAGAALALDLLEEIRRLEAGRNTTD